MFLKTPRLKIFEINRPYTQGLKRLREAGGIHSDQTTAEKLVAAIEYLGLKGVEVEAVDVFNVLPEGEVLESYEGMTNYHRKERLSGGRILGHKFDGIGRGTVHMCTVPEESNLAALIATPVVGTTPVETPKGVIKQTPQARKRMRKNVKEAKDRGVAEASKSKSTRWLDGDKSEGRAQMRVAREKEVVAEMLSCPKPGCKRQFSITKQVAFEKHVATCKATAESTRPQAKEMIADSVGMQKKHASAELSSARDAPQRRVDFPSWEQFMLEVKCSRQVVTEVSSASKNVPLRVRHCPPFQPLGIRKVHCDMYPRSSRVPSD